MDARPAAPPPRHLHLALIAGDSEPTAAVLAVDRTTGRVRITQRAPGDGTVTRSSVLLDERVGSKWRPGVVTPIPWASVTFLFTDHLGLTKDPGFTDNVLFQLLEAPRGRRNSPR